MARRRHPARGRRPRLTGTAGRPGQAVVERSRCRVSDTTPWDDTVPHHGPAPCRRSVIMPIATPDVYNEMLDRAKERGFAYPAINVSSSETLNAAIRGYAEAGSDGIVQVSTGGA